MTDKAGKDIPTYLLASFGSEEGERLVKQHLLLKASAGNRLLEDGVSLPAQPTRVLDLGTGSGSWLLDIAESLPRSVELLGLDVSADHFPEASKLPPNVRLEIHDALDPLPDDLLGTFDLVNVRLLALGLQSAQYGVVAKNVYDALRPGGWFQWMEIVIVNECEESKQTPCLREIILSCEHSFPAMGKNQAAAEQIPQCLEEVGFEEIHHRRFYYYYDSPAETVQGMKKVFSENFKLPGMSILSASLKLGGNPALQSMDDVRRIAEGSAEEIMSGDRNWLIPLKAVAGRKPHRK